MIEGLIEHVMRQFAQIVPIIGIERTVDSGRFAQANRLVLADMCGRRFCHNNPMIVPILA